MASEAESVRTERRRRIVEELSGRRLEEAYLGATVRADLEAEAHDPAPGQIVTPEMLELTRALLLERHDSGSSRGRDAVAPELFFSTDQVVIVPGFLASTLSDVAAGGLGLIWITPALVGSERLSALKLGPLAAGDVETDANAAVRIAATGVLPIFYDLLRGWLELRRYTTEVFPVDWRRNLEVAANRLSVRLRDLARQGRPIHLIAHSQGALVARRALQILRNQGATELQTVKHLVMLGPANFGTFSAVFAIAGTHSSLAEVRRFIATPPEGLQPVLSSMSGLYQLLPFDASRITWLNDNPLDDTSTWPVSIDQGRLRRFFGWARQIDTAFFNDRTTVILGDNKGVPTDGGARIVKQSLVSSDNFLLAGDGTVPHSCSVLPGTATYLARGTEHSMLGTYRSVIDAVTELLAGRSPSLPTRSSDPSDHLTFLTPVRAADEIAAARTIDTGATIIPTAAGEPAPALSSLESLIGAMGAAARQAGMPVRIEIEVGP